MKNQEWYKNNTWCLKKEKKEFSPSSGIIILFLQS